MREDKELVYLRVTCSSCKKPQADKDRTHCYNCAERLTREWIKKETDNPYDK